ncbi:MAG: hypothetical protein ACR2HX_06270 [Pyrinomonadaceae bacterium]
MSKVLLALLGILIAVASPVTAQRSSATTATQTAPPTVEPVDASFVPVVESKSPALVVVSAKRRNRDIRISLRNASDKNIYAFRMRYHKEGTAQLFQFTISDTKTMLAPGEVYVFDYPFSPESPWSRESLVFEAVLFQDGTGDGEKDKVKSLQDLFLTNMKELEHEIALLQVAIRSANVETAEGLRELQKKVSETPETSSVPMLNGLAGLTLPTWKGTTLRHIEEIEKKKQEGASVSIRDELVKVKESYSNTLKRYPGANTTTPDPTAVPSVESKSNALEVVGVTRRDPFLRVRVRNIGEKNISAFQMRYHKDGAAELISFVMSDAKTALVPGEVFPYDWTSSATSLLVNEPLIFEAVIFEDGTGDGDPETVINLQDLFSTNRKELEYDIATLQAALDSADVEMVDSLHKLLEKLAATPESLSVYMTSGPHNLTLPSWKHKTMGIVREIESKKRNEPNTSIRQELLRLKETYAGYLAKYPGKN